MEDWCNGMRLKEAKQNKPEKRFILVGIGEILWDIMPEGPQIGGAPANFAYYVRCLGEEGVVVSRVGEDSEGEKILAKLQSVGLDCRYITIDNARPTGKVTVNIDSNGNPNFEIHKNCAWDYLQLTPLMKELASRADAVCFGSLAQRSPISGEAIREFISLVRDDCLLIFDVNLRKPFYELHDLISLFKKSNVLKVNQAELWILSELFQIKPKKEETIIDTLFSLYPLELIVLTRGAKGSTLFSREKVFNYKGISVNVADTVGAGDAFTATAAVGILKKESLEKINENANRIAAFVCSQKGAWAFLPDYFKKIWE